MEKVPVAISKNGYEIKVGDKVKIVGNPNISRELVNVTERMLELFNTGDELVVEYMKRSMKEPNTALISVAGWWWLSGNLFKIKSVKVPKLKNSKPSLFNIDQLVI